MVILQRESCGNSFFLCIIKEKSYLSTGDLFYHLVQTEGIYDKKLKYTILNKPTKSGKQLMMKN